MYRNMRTWLPVVAAALMLPTVAFAEDATVTPGQFVANNVWMMVATGLVFIMHLGFAALESALLPMLSRSIRLSFGPSD
jgi:hypothetical protein